MVEVAVLRSKFCLVSSGKTFSVVSQWTHVSAFKTFQSHLTRVEESWHFHSSFCHIALLQASASWCIIKATKLVMSKMLVTMFWQCNAMQIHKDREPGVVQHSSAMCEWVFCVVVGGSPCQIQFGGNTRMGIAANSSRPSLTQLDGRVSQAWDWNFELI